MSKCGKGCMPECEYFVTCGCIFPFNCPYKIEENFKNSAFTTRNSNFLSGIEKWFKKLVEEGKIPQTPMNYDTASYKAYVAHLEAENAALRERLDKAVEHPFYVFDKKTGKEADVYEIALNEDWAKHLMYCDMDGFAIDQDGTLILIDECGQLAYCPSDRFEICTESRLKELKGEKE